MIGEDRTDGVFCRQAESLGINESITMMGPQPGHRVADMMRRSRIFCLPSHKEGTPVCVMEALACGLPIVATGVGGIPDIVEHGKTGIILEKGSMQSLTNALVSLLSDSSRCISMGKEAQEFARSHLDIGKIADRLVSLYGETIEAVHPHRE
jgi:glycosyltransferase involved in cell wall biosynthesis